MNNTFLSARRGLALLISALLASLALLALTSGHNRAVAGPYPPTNTCAVSSMNHSVQPGDTINVTGSGFPAKTTVVLKVESTTLGSVPTDANGSFTDTVTIPSSLVGSNHTITASSASVSCSFDPFGSRGVDAVSAHNSNASGHSSSGTDALATTGFETLTASVIAVALLAGGALLLLLGRRRRQL